MKQKQKEKNEYEYLFKSPIHSINAIPENNAFYLAASSNRDSSICVTR
jgi:hypothetical protein